MRGPQKGGQPYERESNSHIMKCIHQSVKRITCWSLPRITAGILDGIVVRKRAQNMLTVLTTGVGEA